MAGEITVTPAPCHAPCVDVGPRAHLTLDPFSEPAVARAECDDCGTVLDAATNVAPDEPEWHRLLGLLTSHVLLGRHVARCDVCGEDMEDHHDPCHG